MTFAFAGRWKEELVCTCAEGVLVLEFPMGTPTVYIPTLDRWLNVAPSWAKDRHSELLEALRHWCSTHGLPLVVDDTATVTAV